MSQDDEPHRGGPPWGRPPRHRPPWWPEDEPWPPESPVPWAYMAGTWRRRHRLASGLGCLVVLLGLVGFGILFASSGQVRWLASYVLFLALVVMILVGSSRLISSFRHRRLETDPIIEAAGRVQDGDYSARVPETGSAEARLLARSFNQMSARLEATDAQRRSFMADVSHELRTPLTVIQGQLEAIRDGVYPADAEHLAPALDQVAVLERLVEDLRTLALSESGSLKLTRESVDVGTLVTEVVSAFEPTAQAAGVTLSVTVTPAVPRAWLDPARIGSVVRNLVANALRYTPAGGGVTIEVAATDTEQVVVSVRDTGRGIDPALLGTVFERFSRSPDSTGSGLGLAIARALVEAHGGTITAASEPGSGTTMTVRLPVGSI